MNSQKGYPGNLAFTVIAGLKSDHLLLALPCSLGYKYGFMIESSWLAG